MFRILLLLSLFVFSLNAQPIKAIQFNGLIHLSQSTAIDMVGLEIGDEPDPLMINNAIKAFFEQRYFEDIWVTHNDGVLTFHFKEKPIISKVDVEGLGDDEEETSGIVNIRKGALYDEKLVEAAKERIISHVNAKGKIDTVVDVEKEQLENGSVELKFVVNKGEDIIIKDIYFKGRKAFDQDELEGVTANRAEEFMGWLWGRNDGEIQLEELSRDNLRIQDLYMQHGYMDAKVEQPFTRIDFNQYTAKIQYKIDEGKPYEVSDVIVSDASGALNIEKLRQIVHMNSGERFNIKTFRDDMTRLKKYVADQGYAYVRINPDMDKDKYNGKVAVTFNVVPGEKVYIRNVEIGGNTRTLDRVIRRELYLAPGHLYSLTDLEDSKTSLGRTGYFESSTIEEKRVSANEIDLVVKVKESPTGSISVGGGYGSYEGFLLSASLSDRNLFGSGLSGSLQFDNSSVNNQQSISITNPHLNDSVYRGRKKVDTVFTGFIRLCVC
jgi:outer membrane protein insertion porin family